MKSPPRVLLLYYSFSSQAKNLLQGLAGGMTERGVTVVWEKIEPIEPPRFPPGTIVSTMWMMVTTFLRIRMPIHTPSEQCARRWDLIVLAGPTWSYNPSGPVLSLLDRHGRAIFAGRTVIPLITCRGYWRTHWWYLRRRLSRLGATADRCMVFTHLNPEPWRTIGVFLKLAGRMPEKAPLISRYYRKYGHTREQVDQARELGERLATALLEDVPLSEVNLGVEDLTARSDRDRRSRG